MTHTTWEIEKEVYPKLKSDLTVDVAVIGGGLSGLATAYLLARSGKRVAVLESHTVGSGATYYTTAMTTQDIDTDVSDLVKMFGSTKARVIWESGRVAIDTIESIVRLEGIECEFTRCPLFMYANTKEQFAELGQEKKAIDKLGFSAGLKRKADVGINHEGVLILKDQAKFHPLKLISGLANAIIQLGGLIYEHTNVEETASTADISVVQTPRGIVFCDQIIITTYQPFKNPLHTFLKKGMYVSYMMELALPRGSAREGIYLDLENPYHYFRVDALPRFDRVLIGGEDHRKEIKMDPKKNWHALEDHVKKIFPKISYTIKKRWMGPILEPIDGLALIGEVREREYVATAFSGNGMTYSFIAGMLLTDLIQKRENSWAEIYNPKRIPTPKQLAIKGRDYTEELFRGAIKNALTQRKKR